MTLTDELMTETEAWLRERDIPFRVLIKYQVKIGKFKRVSYYPTKGTIFVDREDGARTRAGLSGLAEVLINLRELPPEYGLALS